MGVSAVEVKAPRVSDVPAEVAGGGFESKIVRRYERTSRQTQEKLYLEGLSTGDFEPVFLYCGIESERDLSSRSAWCSRKLEECRYAYIWADSVPGSRSMLCVVGARSEGVAWSLDRESTEIWSGVLRSLRDRGLSAPLLARRCAGFVGCARCGVSDDRSSEVLEPPCAERAGEVAEGAEL